MDSQGLITDNGVFSSLMKEAGKVFSISRRLPDFVFKHKFAKYWAIEYAHLYRDSFGSLLASISKIHGDESVHYMTLDPDPRDYYRESRSYGSVCFKTSEVGRYYTAVMNPVQGSSRILAGANVGVFWGSSLKWGIIGDRISWELAVVAADENIDVGQNSGFRCMDPPWLAAYIRSQYHSKDPTDVLSANFVQTFAANYPLSESSQ